MTSVQAVDVDVSLDIGSVTFYPSYVEVTRSVGEAAHAKIKGVTDEPSALDVGDAITVGIDSFDAGGRIFTGRLSKATIDRKGTITIHAYDRYVTLYNKLVNLNTERPVTATFVARDLLSEAGYSVTTNKSAIDTHDAYVAPGSSFPGGDPKEYRVYGSGKSGRSLAYVLNDLADKLGGVFWVDRNNTVRLEPYPDHYAYEVPYITDLSAGSDTVNKTRVIVKGGSPTGELGQAAYSMYNRVSPTSMCTIDSVDSDATKTINDQNVTTKRGTEKLAMSEQYSEGMEQDHGTITIVGNPRIGVFDNVQIPELEETMASNVASNSPTRKIEDNIFSAGSVTHIVDTQNGYTTEISLRPSPESILKNLSGGKTGQLAKDFLTKVKGLRKNAGLLGF